jgi:outer membrane protein assembly factor BamB
MKVFKIILLISILVSVYTPSTIVQASANPTAKLSAPSDDLDAQTPNSTDWYMAGGNPQRTSWVSTEVRGDLKPLWYTPVEPYINPRVQVIATGGKLYLSTAKGLYAFNSDTGTQLWVYPTKFPIAASPTVVGSTAYIGVFDRHIHAVNTSNGQKLWVSDQAGAGFDTSPLVINNKVIAGNRDGYLYAFDTANGRLLWKFKTDGPILFSAAYYDGKIYFVSSDMRAYAVTESGGLVWKSAALPGSGFNSWWPVVYQAPGTDRSKDRIIISGGWNYREDMYPEGYKKFTEMESADAFPSSKQTPGAVISYSEIVNYYTSKPYRKTTIVLNPQTGAEMEIAPALYSWTTNGSRYPAMVGSDGRIYQQAVHTYNQWITGASLISWKPGESNFIRSDDVGYSTPSDEPMYLALGGKVAYFGICCDRYAMAFDTTNHSLSWDYWGYNLNSKFPGYSLYYQRPNCPDDCYGYNNITTHFGTRNGAYGIHGEGNPPIPYNGKVYLHRGNTLLAFAPSASSVVKNPKSMTVNTTTDPVQTEGATSLKDKLATEVQKMLDAGHLRKPYINQRKLYCIDTEMEYWQNSAMTIYILLRALPHLPTSMQTAVRQYMQNEYNTYKPYQVSNEGFAGTPREYHSTPPDAQQQLNNAGTSSGTTLFTHYASWKYAQAFGNAATVFNNIKDRLPSPPSNSELLKDPYKLNEYIAGYWGYLELQKLATGSESGSVRNTLNNLISLRTNNFTNRSAYADLWESRDGTDPQCNQINIASNFLYLVPELAEILRTNNLSQVQSAIAENEFNGPFWFVAFTHNGIGEATLTPLYDVNAIFQAKALILRTPASELEKYLDVSAFKIGDLYYILNLATVLDLGPASPPPNENLTPSPTVQATATSTSTNQASPTPTRTPIATQTPVNTAPPSTPTPSSGGSTSISISNLSESSSVAKYDKQEITFNVTTSATNPQLPFDPTAPTGINGNAGVSVEGVFTSPTGKVWVQPAFYYEIFDDQMKDGTAWFYPTGQAVWKLRFSPDEIGTWQYYIKAQDKTGVAQSGARSFTVTASSNRGFIRASKTDPRYFEYSDGTYFPALGYNAAYDEIKWVNPYANQDYFQKAGSNGIQVIRTWLTYWAIFGSSWNPWYGIRNDYDGYLPRSGIYVNGVQSTPMSSLRLMYDDNNSHWWFDACRFIGGFQAPPAVKQNTKYHIKIRYKAQGITGPRDASFPGYGFVAKVQNPNAGDWHTNCYNGGEPQTGVKVTGYGKDSANWTYLEGEWNSGSHNFLPVFYLALENVRSQSEPTVDIDTVFIGEDMGGGKYGPNIVTKPSMEQLSYYMERNAYAFDKVLDLAKQNEVYLKLVVMEKNELMENELDFAGNRAEFDNNNFYGNYRTMTPVRWYQQAWWRYLQARWGYSPNIFAFEAVNEAEPWNSNHHAQVDEMGKYLHCGVFGVAVLPYDGQKCNLAHPNAHMVSTSFWHSFDTGLFTDNKYPNVDHADIHQYIHKETDPIHFQDTALATYDLGRETGAFESGSGKPIIRGETGLVENDSEANVSADMQGIWLHNLIWGGINPTGLIEHYWYAGEHIYKTVDLRYHFKHYYTFIKDIPLNNGKYVDASAVVSDNKLRAWGQKDLTNQRAHLWIANTDHVWTNKNAIAPINGTVTISGLSASTSFNVEWWDTYAGKVSSTQVLSTNANGEIILTISNLSTDVAVRIARQGTTPANTPTASPTGTLSQTQTPTGTATATQASIGTSTGTATSTPANASTATQTATNTATSAPINTSTATPTPTNPPAATHTPTPTATHVLSNPTASPTATATGTDLPTSTASPTGTMTQTPTNTPTATSTPAVSGTLPPVQQHILTPSSWTTFIGSTRGTIESLGRLEQQEALDDPSTYATFQTRILPYLGYLSFTLPKEIPPAAISDVTLRVNFKSTAAIRQIWTWSIYDWRARRWIKLGNEMAVRGDNQWRMLEFHTQNLNRYLSAKNEIRILLRSNHGRGDAKIDYEVIQITYGADFLSPAKIQPTTTSTFTVTPSPIVSPEANLASPTPAEPTATNPPVIEPSPVPTEVEPIATNLPIETPSPTAPP